jgi:asparagine N-glycosylation enzyme membrane subunit Stt3
MVAGWIVLALVFLGFAVFYATSKTSFLASAYGKHSKHVILFAALAVLSLIAASFARPRRSGA